MDSSPGIQCLESAASQIERGNRDRVRQDRDSLPEKSLGQLFEQWHHQLEPEVAVCRTRSSPVRADSRTVPHATDEPLTPFLETRRSVLSRLSPRTTAPKRGLVSDAGLGGVTNQSRGFLNCFCNNSRRCSNPSSSASRILSAVTRNPRTPPGGSNSIRLIKVTRSADGCGSTM